MTCSYALGCFQAKEEGDAEDEESEGKLEQRFVEADDFSVVWKSFMNASRLQTWTRRTRVNLKKTKPNR